MVRLGSIVSITAVQPCCPLLLRFCCKTPKLLGAKFPAIRRSDPQPPIFVASVPFPRSPMSLWSRDEVPHIFARTSRLRPGEFLVTCAKRLLQQNPPISGLH